MSWIPDAEGRSQILPTVEGMDGVYFDARPNESTCPVVATTGLGHVFAYQQKDPITTKPIGKIPTKSGAGTSFWSPKLNRYYVAAPAHDNGEAAILVFEPKP